MSQTGAASLELGDDLRTSVRGVAGFAALYWDAAWFPKSFGEVQDDWCLAARYFLAAYAHERQGAPDAYRRFAGQAMDAVCSSDGVPGPPLAAAVWDAYLEAAEQAGFSGKLNTMLNPLAIDGASSKRPVTEVLADFREADYNIVAWSKSMLAKGEAEAAVGGLRRIRGVGDKIATFFLRDVCKHFGIAERGAGPGWCLQPVDVWVRRFADSWAEGLHHHVRGDRERGRFLASLAEQAGVSNADLNAGAWVFGSQFLRPDQVAEAATDPGFVRRLVREQERKWQQFSKLVGSGSGVT